MMDDVLRYNTEGYNDPTTYEALKSIDRQERAAGRSPNYRPMVYICSPYRGSVEKNTENARSYCRMAAERGYIPIAPHLLFPQFMGAETDATRELALHMGTILLTKCHELWYFGDRISEGMKLELNRARLRGIPVRHFNENYEEVEI